MKNKSAFTLIETIIAITLITVVLTAVTGLILSTLLANQRNMHTLQANFLAQEGLEAVRYMRDSNWLQNYTWDEGGDLWGSDFDVSGEMYVSSKGCSEPAPCFELLTDPAAGLITLGNDFEFTRTLMFVPVYEEDGATIVDDTLQVTATVSWFERGATRSVELSTFLTDWK